MKWQNLANSEIWRIIRRMGRPALNPPETVRAAILELLADQGVREPVTPAMFRRAVSVRRLRDKLGGGDPIGLGRQIRIVQEELLQANRAQSGTTGIPESLAGHVSALWDAALVTAQEELASARNEAQKTIEAAQAERDDAVALMKMLQNEQAHLRLAENERERRIGELEARLRSSQEEHAREHERGQLLSQQLAEVSQAYERDREQLREQLESRRREYDGLTRRLQNDTDTHRQDFIATRRALEGELAVCRQLLEAVTRERDRLAGDVRLSCPPATGARSRPPK